MVRKVLTDIGKSQFLGRLRSPREEDEHEAPPSSERGSAAPSIPNRLKVGGFHSGGGLGLHRDPDHTPETDSRSIGKVKSEVGEDQRRGKADKNLRQMLVPKMNTRELSMRGHHDLHSGVTAEDNTIRR